MSGAKRQAGLIAAAVLLIIAIVWLVLLERKSPVRALCGRINEFGYSVSPNDFYLQGYGTDVSIRELLENDGVSSEECGHLVELSRGCGFDGDIDKVGKVELLMWRPNDSSVMIAYTVDGTPELLFIEELASGEVCPIG